MLTGSKLRRINDRPRRVNRLPLLAVGGSSVAVAALLYAPLSLPTLAPVALLAGVLGVLVVYRAHRAGAITSVSYEGKLDEGVLARFSEVSEALEALASSEKLWHLTGPAPRPPNAGEASITPEREPARAGLLKTPGIRSDLPIWGLEAGERTVFFFPEGALLHKDDRYEPLRYDLLEVAISTVPFYEKEAVAGDAKVAAEASARSGRPVVLLTLLEIDLPKGRGVVRLQVSSRQAAARFARAFGVESRKSPREWGQDRGQSQGQAEHSKEKDEGAGGTRGDNPPTTEPGEGIASAFATLGVPRGASRDQIGAAYRKLARAHHPDKAANESPEVREESERRMKEINAAYSLLKRQGPGSAEGERAG
jgi:DnaJ-domain-containing protein 1